MPTVSVHAPASRNLPHAFYDQALASLRAMHPEHAILVGRRSATIGRVSYALVAYRPSPGDGVRIDALAVHWPDRRAWDVEAACGPDGWPEGLVRTMEVLAALPDAPGRLR